MIKLSELEELQKTRTELEEEARSLKEEQQECEERVKLLKEKIAIEELKKSNKLTAEAIYQLKSEIITLNQKLKELSQTNETSLEEVKMEAGLESAKQAEEEIVTAVGFEESVTVQQEESGERKKQEEKKRRFF